MCSIKHPDSDFDMSDLLMNENPQKLEKNRPLLPRKAKLAAAQAIANRSDKEQLVSELVQFEVKKPKKPRSEANLDSTPPDDMDITNENDLLLKEETANRFREDVTNVHQLVLTLNYMDDPPFIACLCNDKESDNPANILQFDIFSDCIHIGCTSAYSILPNTKPAKSKNKSKKNQTTISRCSELKNMDFDTLKSLVITQLLYSFTDLVNETLNQRVYYIETALDKMENNFVDEVCLPVFKNIYRPSADWEARLFDSLKLFSLSVKSIPDYSSIHDLNLLNQILDTKYTEEKVFRTFVFIDNFGNSVGSINAALQDLKVNSPLKPFYLNSSTQETLLLLIVEDAVDISNKMNKLATGCRLFILTYE